MPPTLPLNVSDSAQRVELDAGWELCLDVSGRWELKDLATVSGWRAARVGLAWNVQFEDLRDYLGAAWYRTRFDVPPFTDTRHVLLRFGAVDYFCEVFCNGTAVGKHEGGYTPFSFDITSAVRPGGNELVVRVIDPPMDEQQNRSLFPEMMYNEIPHGKQNWYVQNGGIWQGVRLEFCPAIYVDRIDVTPQISGSFRADVRLAGIGLLAQAGAVAASTTLHVTILDNSGRLVFEHSEALGAGHNIGIEGRVSNPKLWGRDSPALYVLEASLEGAVVYRRRVRFGFRSFEARDGRLYLNGEPFYMIAALDQDFYPETIHSPASAEVVRDMMLKAKRLGINVLRCHLKVAHPVYLDTADELGMLVWAELPSWSDCWFPCDHFSFRAAFRGEQMFDEITVRDWNHPCIVVQTIMNESWGINLKDPEQRGWLLNTFDKVKSRLAPLGRLVVDNSACEGNFHLKTDLEDFHNYYSMPDQWPLWSEWVDALSSRPPWTFSPHGDAQRTGREPLLVSEFGNWGLPKLPSDLPWWFHRNFGDREATRPSGVLERFYEFKFDQLFADYNDLAEETQWHQFASLKHEIESIRRHGGLQGYVITGMTDVHWEANGLLDMWRNPKVFDDQLRLLQQPDVVLLNFERLNYRSGERVSAEVLISHYSRRELRGARLRWIGDNGASGGFVIGDTLAPGTVTRVGTIAFDAPQTETALVNRISVEVRLANGTRLMENTFEIFCLPPARTPMVSIAVADSAAGWEARLRSRGYQVARAASADPNTVLLAGCFDTALKAHLSNGGRAVVLVDDAAALPPELGLRVAARAGSELDGRWFSNYNWVRTDAPPFRSLCFSKILGFESLHVVPRHVIQNVDAADFDDVLSGITYGWLNLNSALMLQARVHRGSVLLTTYAFERYGEDAYATELLDATLEYAASADFDPSVQLAPEADRASAPLGTS